MRLATHRLRELAIAAALSFGVTCFITWPEVLHPTLVADHFDPYFSIWRLAQVTRAITDHSVRLFDANIFAPAAHTLAYSDATLLEGVIAAPLLLQRLSPSLVYNILLLLGFVGSGLGMYVLARSLTGAVGPALVATTIFVALPYRTEHLMHLELQWAMFIPLALWAVHRTFETQHWRDGLLTGLFVWLQFLACLYYGIFLAIILLVFAALLWWAKRTVPIGQVLPKLAAGGAVSVVLMAPYILPYLAAAKDVGTRPDEEIGRYSAHLISYLSANELNRLWGWTANLWGSPELRLFPGLVAVAIALASLLHARRRVVIVYLAMTLIAIELSRGSNGVVYPLLLGHIGALRGFRALSRFGIVVGCGISVLAAFGTQAIVARSSWSAARRTLMLTLLCGAILLEYSNRSVPMSFGVEAKPADAYQVLRTAKPGIIAEFPIPSAEALPGWDPYYQAWSIWHWRPMLNGYSGFYARHYLEALGELQDFPDERSLETLRRLNVQYVIVHRGFYTQSEYTKLALKMATAPGIKLWGVFKDPVGTADILEVEH